mmetsp:Transcript_10930/g.12919  ORF Transcript_10930/g.12919 Transcript_10930/m.12919 type:complete len:127 (+) Transcript_10930:73-453(+)
MTSPKVMKYSILSLYNIVNQHHNPLYQPHTSSSSHSIANVSSDTTPSKSSVPVTAPITATQSAPALLTSPTFSPFPIPPITTSGISSAPPPQPPVPSSINKPINLLQISTVATPCGSKSTFLLRVR